MRRIRRALPPAPVKGSRRTGRPAAGLAVAAVTVALLTAGCSMADATCGGGEYPVLAVGGPGSACVPDGEEPPKGYARYPRGKVPEHVGDTWDTYWETRTVDKDGRTVELPEE
ncbi:SCO0607 family lipoprotein [Streptomyces sp. B1I3]|uniref:SCO0607 family lipoprotein n=1 Tax=Streptomyces sp. B1I3 TaxID=3042264 RepID=UPI002786A9A7|nr:hypothetical protein [Streptomyces sp. B1I3]MDQ0794002.1 hypothetical protein [Streptomyces sp. B1I3]